MLEIKIFFSVNLTCTPTTFTHSIDLSMFFCSNSVFEISEIFFSLHSLSLLTRWRTLNAWKENFFRLNWENYDNKIKKKREQIDNEIQVQVGVIWSDKNIKSAQGKILDSFIHLKSSCGRWRCVCFVTNWSHFKFLFCQSNFWTSFENDVSL